MPVDDRTRLNLHRKLDAVLGPEEADTLMAHLPPVTWNDVATKDDLHVLERTLRSEFQAGFAELRGEMQAGFGELRGEMQAVRAELRSEMQALRTDLRSEMQAAFGELRDEMHEADDGLRIEMRTGFADLRTELANSLTTQTKWMVTVVLSWSAVLLTAVRYLP